MPLNESKGNMYDFITHTWNTVKGKCPHDCSYCYMKRWGNQKPARFDEKELKTDLGQGNFIFVGSSNDLFASMHDYNWVSETLYHCIRYPDNRYLFQTKDPGQLYSYKHLIPEESVICVTLESNRHYKEIMKDSPAPFNRAMWLIDNDLKNDKYITIEPIMDFGLGAFVEMIKSINPVQINIGADSGNNNLPEPPWLKVEKLIEELQEFTTVKLKKNLDRLRKS